MKLIVYKGQSRSLRFTVTTDTGVRESLTGATIEFQVKAKDGDADPPLIAKAISSGVLLLDQSNAKTKGQFDVELAPGDTSALAAAIYRYDAVVVLGGKRHYVVPPSDFDLREVVNQA